MPINYPTYSDPWVEMSVENAQIFVQSFLDQWQTNSLPNYQNTKAVYTPESNMIMANNALGDIVADPTAYTNFIFIGYIYFTDTTTDRLKISDGSSNIYTFNGTGAPVSRGYYPVIFNAIDSIPNFYAAFLGYKFNVVVPEQNKIVAQFNSVPGILSAGFEIRTENKNPITVEWGDGTSSSHGVDGVFYSNTIAAIHNYNNPGQYVITVYCDIEPTGYFFSDDYGSWCAEANFYETTITNVVNFNYQQLNEESINNILIQLDGGTRLPDPLEPVILVTLNGVTPPTGEGLAAKNRLIARGWTVQTD